MWRGWWWRQARAREAVSRRRAGAAPHTRPLINSRHAWHRTVQTTVAAGSTAAPGRHTWPPSDWPGPGTGTASAAPAHPCHAANSKQNRRNRRCSALSLVQITSSRSCRKSLLTMSSSSPATASVSTDTTASTAAASTISNSMASACRCRLSVLVSALLPPSSCLLVNRPHCTGLFGFGQLAYSWSDVTILRSGSHRALDTFNFLSF